MLPRVTLLSGCCTLQPRSRSRYNPHYTSELRVSGMQRKHFKGSVQPTASRGPATVCLILWILAGSATLENSFHPARVSPQTWPEYRWLSSRLLVYDYLPPLFNFCLPTRVALYISLDPTLLNDYIKRIRLSVMQRG